MAPFGVAGVTADEIAAGIGSGVPPVSVKSMGALQSPVPVQFRPCTQNRFTPLYSDSVGVTLHVPATQIEAASYHFCVAMLLVGLCTQSWYSVAPADSCHEYVGVGSEVLPVGPIRTGGA